MAHKKILELPLNRVEGDLEIKLELDNDRVIDAWSSGTMFRGIERILMGRGALDGLVITPRICGICGTAHLMAACKALDSIAGVKIPDNAIKLRNIALMVEHIQSDVRHWALMFAGDFANLAYREHSLYDEAVRRYEPFKGEMVIQTIQETKKVLEIIAILGGQWPHSAYMVPGGVVSVPTIYDLNQCAYLLNQYRTWYEKKILGCTLSRWQEIKDADDLSAWLEEKGSHKNSEIGFFVRFSREAGLDKIGRGPGSFISYGSLDMPEDTRVQPLSKGSRQFIPAGFASGADLEEFDQMKISEHVAYSWFEKYEGGKHPLWGETKPFASGGEKGKYSWAKAPRYDDKPAETGPLAELIISKIPLFVHLSGIAGPNVFIRELARLARPAYLIEALDTWIREIRDNPAKFYHPPGEIKEGEGFGLIQASRGALGHWVKIREASIIHYQIITPTAWHASPRDTNGVRGPFEEALIGTIIKDEQNPVEAGHIVRSFDACLVCTVHGFSKGKKVAYLRL